MDKTQVKMLLELSDKDIKELKRVRKVLSEYTKYEQKLVDDLTARMKANGLTELGDVKLVSERGLKTFELSDLTDTFLSDELQNKLIITVDIDKTIKNLQEYGYTEAHIKPLVDHILLQVGTKIERLVINENVSNRK